MATVSFPKQIQNAIGNPMEALEQIEEVPSYALNLRDQESTNIEATIKRGCDASGRPFLVVYVPHYSPLIYCSYTTCRNATDFADLKNWQVSTLHKSTSLTVTIHNFAGNALELLSQIMKREDCSLTRQALRMF